MVLLSHDLFVNHSDKQTLSDGIETLDHPYLAGEAILGYQIGRRAAPTRDFVIARNCSPFG